MPILTVPNENDPLSQGDILKGLRLYSTGTNWDDPRETGGSAAWAERYDLCLVLSRPCNLEHKEDFLAAAIHFVREGPSSEITCFAEAKHYLEKLRDGRSRPDRFYLGQIPALAPGRYYAHLDSIHTVSKPPAEKLREFLRKGRIAKLAPDFIRDLHVRIFSAVASLGFDDIGWLSDQDLKLLLDRGKKDLLAKQTELQDLRASLSEIEASGEQRREQHVENDRNRAAALEKEITEFEEKLRPYKQEIEARGLTLS